MEENNQVKENSVINLSNAAQFATLIISLSIGFALISLHLYYQMLLKIPIFQYLEASEIALIAASTGITLAFYMGSLSLVSHIQKKYQLIEFSNIVICLLFYFFAFMYAWVAYRNDPIFKEFIIYPGHHIFIFIIGVSVMVVFVMYVLKKPIIQNNRFVLPILITVWYALFTGWANYQVITDSPFTIDLCLKSKTGEKIITDRNIIYAGRTKNYWFFYNRKTHFTRVVKNENIEVADFNSK